MLLQDFTFESVRVSIHRRSIAGHESIGGVYWTILSQLLSSDVSVGIAWRSIGWMMNKRPSDARLVMPMLCVMSQRGLFSSKLVVFSFFTTIFKWVHLLSVTFILCIYKPQGGFCVECLQPLNQSVHSKSKKPGPTRPTP